MKEYWYEIKKYRFTKIEILFAVITILLPIRFREDMIIAVMFISFILIKIFYLKSKKTKTNINIKDIK
ncbi:MAG: hypothetical protein WBH44_01730 [Proteocatella sp.]